MTLNKLLTPTAPQKPTHNAQQGAVCVSKIVRRKQKKEPN